MDVSVAEFKANLSSVLKRAEEGEPIHVTRHGKPYITLKPENHKVVDKSKRLGLMKGEVELPDNLLEILSDPGEEWEPYM